MTFSNSANGARVLLVEDDEDIQFAVRMILESASIRVSSASNGREALKFLEQEGLPDLILLDMLMPVMDGWKFAKEFRLRHDRQVPIVVMTAASDAARRAQDVQAEGYVSKPFQIEELLETVLRHLQSEARGIVIRKRA